MINAGSLEDGFARVLHELCVRT